MLSFLFQQNCYKPELRKIKRISKTDQSTSPLTIPEKIWNSSMQADTALISVRNVNAMLDFDNLSLSFTDNEPIEQTVINRNYPLIGSPSNDVTDESTALPFKTNSANSSTSKNNLKVSMKPTTSSEVSQNYRPRRSVRLMSMQTTAADSWSNASQLPKRRTVRLQSNNVANYCIDVTNAESSSPDKSFVFCKPSETIRPLRRSMRVPVCTFNLVPTIINVSTLKQTAAKKPVKRLNAIEDILPVIKKTGSKAEAFAEHRKGLLKMFNTGSTTDLQKLPLIGPKAAYQIVVHRSVFNV